MRPREGSIRVHEPSVPRICRKRSLTPASELNDEGYTPDVGGCSKCGGLHRPGECPAESCHKCKASD